MKKPYLGLYGNIGIKKGWCGSCKSYSFVFDGLLECCGAAFDRPAKKIKRECQPQFKRKRLSKTEQKEILEIQNNKCFYCGNYFGDIRYRNLRAFQLKLNWDHLIPFVFSQNNYAYNFVASCHVCNSIKSDKFFESLDDAKEYLKAKRESKGYDF